MNIQIHDIFVYIICGTVHLLSFKSVTLLIKILQCRRRLRYRTPRSLSTCRHLVMFTIIHSSITIWSFRNFYPCCYLCKSMALIDAHPSWHLFTPDSSDAYRSRRFLLFWNFLPYLLFQLFVHTFVFSWCLHFWVFGHNPDFCNACNPCRYMFTFVSLVMLTSTGNYSGMNRFPWM